MELTYSFGSLVRLEGHTVHNPENHNLNVYRCEYLKYCQDALFEDIATGDCEDVTVVFSNMTLCSWADRYRRFRGM
jgi:hypothetical protein